MHTESLVGLISVGIVEKSIENNTLPRSIVKKQFKNLPLNMPVMLYRQYSTIGVENTQCKGKPWHVHGTTADGLCHKNTITTINKNRSISMRQFTNDGCTGEVWNNVTLTAAQMSGNCIDGTRIKALGSRTLRG